MVHISCGQRHALDGQSQAMAAALRRFSFYNIEGGEFGCPMCRSVANCLVPCVPDKELFESPSFWDEAATHPGADIKGMCGKNAACAMANKPRGEVWHFGRWN
ncbi:unnamed protein product [Cladocopium goreaui]|uniref:Beta-N-acetylhexosaminidase n=1 Tax=Cladocopium goreaui TaxID=2562237 RepID=A0A9P1DLH1_9DINO|nr:unnamed protein product [Cladocopium goreaui]